MNRDLNLIKSNITCSKFDWASFLKAALKFKKPGCHRESMIASLSKIPAAGDMDVRTIIVADSDDGNSTDDYS